MIKQISATKEEFKQDQGISWGTILRVIVTHYHGGSLEIPDSLLENMSIDHNLLIYRTATGITISVEK